ncbi:MAG: BatD family protein [Cytophagales bacterium]|nr:BatD family protein [Bernardetiaceae bacterium]MDW8204768.1 BatD family protein [Cytophagales bacterium]
MILLLDYLSFRMQRIFAKFGLLFAFTMLGRLGVLAQEVQIEIPKTEISTNESLQIKISVVNGKINEYSIFPVIRGFTKSDISSGEQQVIMGGRLTQIANVVQNYRPLKEGTYNVQPFTMMVNGKQVRFLGTTVTVTAATSAYDFWASPDLEPEVDWVREDVFLAVATDVKEIYAGQAVNVVISFYALQSSPYLLKFPDNLFQLLSAAVKKLKPENCWEENFNIGGQIVPTTVKIKGKDYQQYKIYQSSYYINQPGEVTLPAISLPLIRLRPGNYGREEKRNYTSKPITIRVKPLPPHPMREKIAVGKFRLEEKVSQTTVKTGQSFNYDFHIIGQGNFSFLREPDTRRTLSIEMYPPNVQQQINRENGRVLGSKKFSYMIIANEPGNYNMADYFQWIFFNIETQNYDTLKPKISVRVEGESRTDKIIGNTSSGAYYDNIYLLDNHLTSLDDASQWKWILSFALGGSAIIGLILAAGSWFKRKKDKLPKNYEL